jgi:AcrR family transcriptional regulator
LSPRAKTAPAPSASPARFSQAARELLRERVLDSLGELLAANSWSELTMADVAARAGVSRQSVYNGFGARAELARVYIAREAERFLAGADAAIREHAHDPIEALTAALAGFLQEAKTHPLLAAITSREGAEDLLPLVTTRGGPLVHAATERLSRSILDTWPEVARSDAKTLSEVLVRLAISYAALSPGPARQTAQRLACMIGPAIERMLGERQER